MLRPCLTCGEPSARTRCPACTATHEARRPSRRMKGRYDRLHDRLRAVTLREQPWCSICRTPGSEANPLQADHILPHQLGGKNVRGNYQTLCRSCNAAKRDRIEVRG
jgi:5-methylcytosine-specific restriction endonuclease McrA